MLSTNQFKTSGMPLLMHFAKPDKENLSHLPFITDDQLKFDLSVNYLYKDNMLPEQPVEYYCGKPSVTHKKTATSTKNGDKSNDTNNND